MNRHPIIEIETARLILRPSDSRSAAELRPVLSDPRVAGPYFGCPNPLARQAEARPWAQGEDDWARRCLMTLAARERATGALLGAVRFDQGQISFLVHPLHWRQGYGAEMVQAGCRSAFRDLGLGELHAAVMRENLGSRRILEGAGFVFAGLTLREGQGRPLPLTVLQYRRQARAAAARYPTSPDRAPG